MPHPPLAAALVVAVVDDDELIRLALHDLLSGSECEVELYESAEAFLAAAATSKAHCLMIDINLGGISGIELGRRLAAVGHRAPIIYMTASTNKAMQQQALDLGCVALLQKPFTQPALLEALDAARRRRL
jgi:FixJ family two-component response regulator